MEVAEERGVPSFHGKREAWKKKVIYLRYVGCFPPSRVKPVFQILRNEFWLAILCATLALKTVTFRFKLISVLF